MPLRMRGPSTFGGIPTSSNPDHSITLKEDGQNGRPLSVVRPARTYSNGCKSLSRPDSGKVTAKGKGVRRETESGGSRRQTSGLTDRNPIKGLRVRIRLQKKSKPDNYPKSPKVNRADIRWKEYVHNWRDLAGERKRAVTTNCEKSAEAIVPA